MDQMEALADAILNGREEPAGLDDAEERVEHAPEAPEATEASPGTGAASGSKRQVLKRGIFKAASMQDRLLEK